MTRTAIQEYIERQPGFAWRRWILRTVIRTIGFGVIWPTKITGTENIPATGSTILMMNHISGIDPVLCMGAVTKRFVIPMSKVENTRTPLGPFLWWYGAYVVRRGEVDRAALLNSIALLQSGQMILIAPEGTRHPEGLAEAKDGLAYIATKANAVILPTAISGDAPNYQQNLKRLRRTHIRINFGRPFRFKTQGRSRIPRDELAVMTTEAMYQLALAHTDENLRGVYRDVSRATTQTLEFV